MEVALAILRLLNFEIDLLKTQAVCEISFGCMEMSQLRTQCMFRTIMLTGKISIFKVIEAVLTLQVAQ